MELTKDQNKVLEVFSNFLTDPNEKYMVLQGAAGTGKSTLITYLFKALQAQIKMYSLLLKKNTKQSDFEIVLAATTNKAVAVMEELTGMDARTIHSVLNLSLQRNHDSFGYHLVKTKQYELLYNKLIIIDEASMMDDHLFHILDDTTQDCKIVLIGDEYQLAPVKQKYSIMHTLDATKVAMNKVMRHAGSILNTGAKYRHTVKTDKWHDLPVNDSKLVRCTGEEFQTKVDEIFTQENYIPESARILAWTNRRVMDYNNYVRKIKGYPATYEPGEFVFTNNPIIMKSYNRQTDSQIQITNVSSPTEKLGVKGHIVELDNKILMFLPSSHLDVKALTKKLAKQKKWNLVYEIKETWLDLRPAYASTVHKSQGSQYDTVFIDLTDMGKCNIASDVARMMYVAISRAKNQIYFYGELPPRYRGE